MGFPNAPFKQTRIDCISKVVLLDQQSPRSAWKWSFTLFRISGEWVVEGSRRAIFFPCFRNFLIV